MLLLSCSSSKTKFLVIWREVKSATAAAENAQAIRLAAFLQLEGVSFEGVWLNAEGKPKEELLPAFQGVISEINNCALFCL